MPYLLLIIGVLLGLYALYRFFLRADVRQIKALLLTLLAVSLCVALVFLALTGRLPAALAIVVALVPVMAGIWREARKPKNGSAESSPSSSSIMTRKDALDVLGLDEDAGEEDIHNAYKTLMKKVHPDQEGSGWMAAKLNEAKDFLLKDR